MRERGDGNDEIRMTDDEGITKASVTCYIVTSLHRIDASTLQRFNDPTRRSR